MPKVDLRKKVTKAILKLVSDCIFDGLTDEETALLAGISSKTVQRMRTGEECPAVKKATLVRKRHYIQLIRDGNDRTNHWQRIAWFLERRYPSEFAKPEVQLTLASTTNTTHQTLVVTAEVANDLAKRASTVDSEVSKLLDAKAKAKPAASKDK